MPKISITMATYNGEKYLLEQLESLKKQSFKDFELIIVDDCSKDSTVNIIKEFQLNFPLTLIENSTNLGYIKNFEKAISLEKGEYIAPCDQDDTWSSNKLQLLIEHIGENSLIYSNSLLVDEKGNSLNQLLSQKLKNHFTSFDSPLSFIYDNAISAHAMLFNRELLTSIFPFPKTLYFDAWIAANAAACKGIHYLDQTLVNYRQHSTNTLSSNKKTRKKIKKTAYEKRRDSHLGSQSIIDDMLLSNLLSPHHCDVLHQLKLAHSKFPNSFFNFQLYQTLQEHKKQLFAIKRKNPLRRIIKMSFGEKIIKLTSK